MNPTRLDITEVPYHVEVLKPRRHVLQRFCDATANGDNDGRFCRCQECTALIVLANSKKESHVAPDMNNAEGQRRIVQVGGDNVPNK